MNKIEKLVYDALKRHPQIKLFVRDMYQNVMDLIPDKPNFTANDAQVLEGYFWGFHDVSPISNDERHMLGCKLNIPLRMPQPGEPLTIGYWELQGNQHSSFLIPHSSFKEVADCYAWGYHKGCRLQWLGNSNDTFIFNTAHDGQLCAEIHRIPSANETAEGNSSLSALHSSLSFPIDTVSWDGRYATSFSYRRLNELMPGYGYDIEDGSFLDEGHPADTGLYIVDVEKNTRRLLFSLEHLASLEPTENMKGARHFVTHTEFSKDNQYVIFMHRWIHDDPDKRFSRLITCRLDGSELYISPTTDMVSHYVWDEKWGILAFCRINNVDGHYLFSDHTMKRWRHVAPQLNSDGHQSFIPGADAFITDTYPDGRRYAKLWRVDLNTDETKLLADLKSPKEFQSPNCYRNWCCDLHPRVSPQGTYVTFDSVHTNHRALCVMKL